jgi:hypothetical protein
MAVRLECSFFSPVYAVFFMIQCLLGIDFEVQKEMFHDLSRVGYGKNFIFNKCGNTTIR